MSAAVRAELERRWLEMLKRTAQGDDIPPSLRLRAEGLMEALVLAGVCTADELQSALADCHRRERGVALPEVLGERWREEHPFPQIPFFQQRAPVYPGAAEDA